MPKAVDRVKPSDICTSLSSTFKEPVDHPDPRKTSQSTTNTAQLVEMAPTIDLQPTQVQTNRWLTPPIIAKITSRVQPHSYYTANVALYDCTGTHVPGLQGNTNTQGKLYNGVVYFLWDWLKIVQAGIYEIEISIQEWSHDGQAVKSCGTKRTAAIDVVNAVVPSQLCEWRLYKVMSSWLILVLAKRAAHLIDTLHGI